ncbi:MAG: prolyl-tRNA synthetase associated domain-containing protein [Pseudomonadota bacterium]
MSKIASIASPAPLLASETLLAYLIAQAIPHHVYHHEAVFTVAEANKISAVISGAHTRNLFLRDKKGRMFLVTLRHNTPVDLKKLSDVLGVGRFSFGSAARLWENLGVTAGSVTPLAILNDRNQNVTLVLEEGMMAEESINVHPLINTMTVSLSPTGLMTILKDCAITPLVIDFTNLAPDTPPQQMDITTC